MTERLHIDWTRCEARGLCLEIVPELLVGDDWGYPMSHDRSKAPVVARNVAVHARRAVTECPRLALSIRTDATPQNR